MAPRFDDYDSMSLLGDLVVQAAARLGRRIAIIASGDLSHRLLPGSPNGYTPKGAIFDKTVMEALQKQDPAILKTMSAASSTKPACAACRRVFPLRRLRHFRPVMPIYSYEGPSRRLWRRPVLAGSQENGLKTGCRRHPRPPGPGKHLVLPDAPCLHERTQRPA